jgi:DNA-3-methyladenine glycosylase II
MAQKLTRAHGPSVCRTLEYRPPYDWNNVLGFFRAHQIPYLESVDETSYERVLSTKSGLGRLRVVHSPNSRSLQLTIWNTTDEDAAEVTANVGRMFDVSANPEVLRDTMKADRYLSTIWTNHPGLRVARSWSGYEALITTVLGQLVSVSFGRVLIDELMRVAGSEAFHPKTAERIFLFPSARQLLGADLSKVRTSVARRATIRSLARLIDEEVLNLTAPISTKALRKILRSVPGVGAWTVEYAAMRGFDDDDAFPATDYALKQELQQHPGINLDCLSPWRAYAAVALWRNFAEKRKEAHESVV